MAPHSSTLGWKIPWMEEPGGLRSMGSHRVGHDWSDLAAAAAAAEGEDGMTESRVQPLKTVAFPPGFSISEIKNKQWWHLTFGRNSSSGRKSWQLRKTQRERLSVIRFHKSPYPRPWTTSEMYDENIVYILMMKRLFMTKLQTNLLLRQWHPTPVLLAGKSHGWRNLVDYSPWGRKGSDTTEWLHRLKGYHCIII